MNLDIHRRVLAGEPLTAFLPGRSLWRLSGPDAERYLNGQVTTDVTLLTEGRASYAAVCTAKGRMEGDITISRHSDVFYLDADPVLRESLGARLDKFLIADDALLEDISEEWILTHVFGTNPPSSPEGGFVIQNSRFGVTAFDVWNPVKPGHCAVDAPVDDEVLETLRLEHAIGKWGTELTPNTLPPEAGPHMLTAISYTKGCYVGQETIARLKSVGHVNKTLVFLRSATEQFPPVGAKLLLEEREVGAITSSGFSPSLTKGIALAYVQRQHATDGTLLRANGFELTIAPSLAKTQS